MTAFDSTAIAAEIDGNRGGDILTADNNERRRITLANGYRFKILNRMERRIDDQQIKGFLKYKKPLSEERSMPLRDRMEHIAQELTDALMYNEHIIIMIQEIEELSGRPIEELLTELAEKYKGGDMK